MQSHLSLGFWQPFIRGSTQPCASTRPFPTPRPSLHASLFFVSLNASNPSCCVRLKSVERRIWARNSRVERQLKYSLQSDPCFWPSFIPTTIMNDQYEILRIIRSRPWFEKRNEKSPAAFPGIFSTGPRSRHCRALSELWRSRVISRLTLNKKNYFAYKDKILSNLSVYIQYFSDLNRHLNGSGSSLSSCTCIRHVYIND